MLDHMTTLLGLATATLPQVDRAYLAGGPSHARTCEQLVVYGSQEISEGAGPRGVNQFPMMPGGCAVMVVPTIVLAYTKDCYPMPGDKAPGLPPAAKLTAWTTEWETNVSALLDAVVGAVVAGVFGMCGNVSLLTRRIGPQAGVSTIEIALTIRS